PLSYLSALHTALSLCSCACCGAPPPLPSFPTRRSSDLWLCPFRFWLPAARGPVVLPRRGEGCIPFRGHPENQEPAGRTITAEDSDRKSTRLNSSHQIISYAVFCLKKKRHFARAEDTVHT